MVFLQVYVSVFERISYLCIPKKNNKYKYNKLIFKTITHYVELVRM